MLDAASPLLDVLVLMDTGSHDILLPEWGEWEVKANRSSTATYQAQTRLENAIRLSPANGIGGYAGRFVAWLTPVEWL
jgi:hypothetical protein